MSEKDIEELRAKIDKLDQKLIDLLSERLEVVDDILEFKEETGEDIRDREREQRIIEKVREQAKGMGLDQDFAEDVMWLVISRTAGAEKEKAGEPSMWGRVEEAFAGSPAQLEVARVLYKYGFRVKEDDDIVCGDIRIPAVQIAEEAGVDRRAVSSTVQTIFQNEYLREIFGNLKPIPYLKAVAQHLNLGVIEILPPDATQTGIISDVTRVISKNDVTIRQSIAEDPFFTAQPRLTIITEEPVSGEVIEQLRELESVESVILY